MSNAQTNAAFASSVGDEDAARSSDLRLFLCQLAQLRRSDAILFLTSEYGNNPIPELCQSLKTSPSLGLSLTEAELSKRRDTFGFNEILHKEPKTFGLILAESFKDIFQLTLLVTAFLSLGLSFYDDGIKSNFHEHHISSVDIFDSAYPAYMTNVYNKIDLEAKASWVEATAIIITAFITGFASSLIRYHNEQQISNLRDKIEADQHFTVIRKGVPSSIPVKDIVVGDICQLQCGDVVPADGLVLYSNELKCDETSLTGESEPAEKSITADPVLLSGTQVTEGNGCMLVIAVGQNSQSGLLFQYLEKGGLIADRFWCCGHIWRFLKNVVANLCCFCYDRDKRTANKDNSLDIERSSISNRTDDVTSNSNPSIETILQLPNQSKWSFNQITSPLQTRASKLATRVGYIGLFSALVTVLVLSARFCIETFEHQGEFWNPRYLIVFVRFIIFGVSIIIVSSLDGLPLAVSLILTFAAKQMKRSAVLVRRSIDVCERVGNVSSIICDKTGLLTVNKMTVVEALIGGRRYSHNAINDTKSQCGMVKSIPAHVSDLIVESICVNSSPYSTVIPSFGPTISKQFGNRTECALLSFVLRFLPPPQLSPRSNSLPENPIDLIRSRYSIESGSIVKVFPFDSARKTMITAVRLTDELNPNIIRIFVKGAAELVLNRCNGMLSHSGEMKHLSTSDRSDLNRFSVQPMSCSGLRTMCIAFRDYSEEEAGKLDWSNEEAIASNLICIGILGIADPLRNDVAQAVKTCQKAGVTVLMITGDSLEAAQTAARSAGIIPQSETAVELSAADCSILDTKEFNKRIRNPNSNNIEQSRFDAVWPKLRVLARATPEDKLTLVIGIQSSQLGGNVLAVTGQGPNDSAALRESPIGISLGISGSDVCREASDIILGDDNFCRIVSAIAWGQNVYRSLAKLIQFQITLNVVAALFTVISAVIVEDAVITAVQLLFLNLIVKIIASLAFSTEPVSSNSIQKTSKASLVSSTMAKNILLSSIYQLGILLFLTFYGEILLQTDLGRWRHLISTPSYGLPTQHFSAIFNVFGMMTLTNQLCSRTLNNDRNILSQLHKSRIFLCLWLGCFVAHILAVQFGSVVFRTSPLNIVQWAWCVLFGIAGPLIWHQIIASLPLERCHILTRWFGPPLSQGQAKVDEKAASQNSSAKSSIFAIFRNFSSPLETNF